MVKIYQSGICSVLGNRINQITIHEIELLMVGGLNIYKKLLEFLTATIATVYTGFYVCARTWSAPFSIITFQNTGSSRDALH